MNESQVVNETNVSHDSAAVIENPEVSESHFPHDSALVAEIPEAYERHQNESQTVNENTPLQLPIEHPLGQNAAS